MEKGKIVKKLFVLLVTVVMITTVVNAKTIKIENNTKAAPGTCPAGRSENSASREKRPRPIIQGMNRASVPASSISYVRARTAKVQLTGFPHRRIERGPRRHEPVCHRG